MIIVMTIMIKGLKNYRCLILSIQKHHFFWDFGEKGYERYNVRWAQRKYKPS